jgi:predicted  nucleic acid-binding Zn-ribbon protein
MGSARLERRIVDLQRQIERARDRAAVLAEQCSVWRDMYDNARIRSLVAETPLAERESADLARQVDLANAALAKLRDDIRDLELTRDRLFENWHPEVTT